MFLLTRAKAQALKTKPVPSPESRTKPEPEQPVHPPSETELDISAGDETEKAVEPQATRLVVAGKIPTEVWNRLGMKLLPKLRSGEDLQIEVRFTVSITSDVAVNLEADLRQALQDLGLQEQVQVQRT